MGRFVRRSPVVCPPFRYSTVGSVVDVTAEVNRPRRVQREVAFVPTDAALLQNIGELTRQALKLNISRWRIKRFRCSLNKDLIVIKLVP